MVVFYSETTSVRSYVADVPLPPAPLTNGASNPAQESDPVVCHCLQVPQSSIVEAVRDGGARSLCELARLTGAGSGCTSCHRKLRQYLNERRITNADLQNAATAK
jgi:bacterioferritin-associated ferredoxin